MGHNEVVLKRDGGEDEASGLLPSEAAERVAASFLAGYSGNTQAAYLRDLRAWATWCTAHGLPLMEASRAHVELYARSLEQEGRAASTIARALSTLAGFYRYAVDEGLLERSPVTSVRRPRTDDESGLLGLDKGELVRLLSQAEASGVRDHALVCLLALNGLRVSEACGADVIDLSEQRGHRTLSITRKGSKKRLVPLAPRTAHAVTEAVGERSHGPLLVSLRSGERLNRRDAARIVVRLAESAGIDKQMSPHVLRHAFVTLALDAGVSLRDVQDAAGHADPRTTRRYDRARHNLDRHATYAVATLVGGD